MKVFKEHTISLKYHERYDEPVEVKTGREKRREKRLKKRNKVRSHGKNFD